jgi:hypothetical protein
MAGAFGKRHRPTKDGVCSKSQMRRSTGSASSRGYVRKGFEKEAPTHHLLLGCAPVNVFTLREHIIAVVCSKRLCDKKQKWPSSIILSTKVM